MAPGGLVTSVNLTLSEPLIALIIVMGFDWGVGVLRGAFPASVVALPTDPFNSPSERGRREVRIAKGTVRCG